MKAWIALSLTVLLLAAQAGHSQAATTPVDPDHASIAAVDRFSAEAGHLQLRTATNGIPGPNVPVDFDKGPFITQGLSTTGKVVRYYNFDVQSTTPAPVYVLYREDQPVADQLDIIDSLPGEKGYNDFHQVWKVSVPKDYVANTITDVVALKAAGYKMQRTDALRNMPVVPDRSLARMRLNGENPGLQRAWYKSEVAKYFSFNEAMLTGSSVPVSPIYVTFNINPGVPNGGPSSGFRTEINSVQTHNVPATLPGDPGYSPLWFVSVYDNSDFPAVHDLNTVLKAKVLAGGVATVNCPIVFAVP